MQRYFINEPFNGQESAVISGEDYHHITRVMRMKPGDRLYVVFEGGEAGIGMIDSIMNSSVEIRITGWEEAKSKELPVEVTIASGLPKGDKWEWIIQKGTELGASQFVPFIAARSIVKWEEKKASKKLDRWKKIAKEAAEQSHRQKIPRISEPLSFKQLLTLGDSFDYKAVAYEEAAKNGEKSGLAQIFTSAGRDNAILLVFGPEGGFEEEETEQLQANGFKLVGLGPRILRTETAPLYALSAVSYHFELMR
ncbi:MAG TPA: 16S rRNA (uracil(1498)-N(3))-methyltransferase [Bacillus bacterium]|uniref:Ribosomal RNA small subunit methyltransferase E n=1 Tax=Siminovitchia fordii TaxID=254759 RepID=A0ABQ4K4H7_9BACI|nr:16S rRNA (uracil(1498)-N(3))-methyltransferase [Siminovitchia fordii]GIN20043.1 ribosomal RNA small subunit methyltransferase E [Siminovitchia fordii]HBZ09065.1 16S rRNA (uracil(1498)-N(3))-methyltransferase [Bacillus sp. (in: firmicutes)]